MSQRARFVLITLALLASAALPAVASAQSIHEFTGADGAAPAGDLVQGGDGLLYGWTSAGGTFNRGTLFRVAADGTGFQTLYSFGEGSLPSDGAVPQKGGLLEVAPGLFYGTTFEGGLNGRGALFTLDVSGDVPVVTTLHSFATTEPGPDGGVIRSSGDGLLYGTTSGAGWGDFGTIYRVATDGSGFTVLHRFIGFDGEAPTGLIEGSDGWLYGTTRRGGTADAGVVFRASRDGIGALQVLAHLEGRPEAGLTEVVAQDGGGRYLYGVEAGGGPGPFGSIFRLRLDGTGFQRTATFSGGSDGAYPRSRLILGRDGVLYGTASSSAGGCGTDLCGSVFRVLPTGQPYTIRAFTLANGALPDGALVQGADGHLYGTTREGGDVATSAGVVFVVRDPATVPLHFTGALSATEGQAVTYDLTLDNTVGVRLSGPFTVNLTVSAGLQFVSVSTASDWSCTTSASGLTCQWPFDLDAGAATPINRLTFMPTPPFSTACGIGPSPCMSVRAELRAAGVSVLVAGTVSPLAGGTPNAGPQPADDVVGVAGQIPATVYVLANDTDPDGDPLTVVDIMTPPTAGDAVINPDGSIVYQAFEALTQNDSFRYRVSDGRGSTATALVTLEPGIPALRTSKLVIDVGPLAVGRVAGGRTTAYSNFELSGRIRLEALTPRELTDFLAGTTYDPAQAVSDPTEFHAEFWRADTVGSMVTIYFRPTVVGRVSVARAVLTTDMAGLAPVTTSLIIVGAGADPATAPVRATDDTFTIPMNTPTAIDVLANDGTESGGTRPLYAASFGACGSVIGLNPPPGWAPCANGIGGSVTGPPSIQGSQLFTVSPPNGATGIGTFAYASAELDACFGPPRAEGACQLETTMYFAAVTVNVVPPDQADLGVSLTATPGVVPLGDAVTLRLTVTNTGPDTARAVTLSGLGVLSLSHTIEGVTSSLGSCAPDTASGLACDLGDLAANQSATVEVVARATAQVFEGITEPQVSVLLGVSVASASDDPTPANNSVLNAYVVRRPQADLGVSLTATPGTVPLGDAVTLRLTVTNGGPDPARAVRLSGLGVLSLSHTIEGVTPSLGSCTTDAAGLVCALGDLAANQSATVDVVARATAQVFAGITDPQTSVLLGASVASTSTNIPGISVLPATDDPAPANNSVFTSYVVRRPLADLGVSLTATPGTVPLGEAVTVRLTVTNVGPDTARAVTLSGLGVLSTTHTIERVTPSLGSCTPTPAAGVECALGDLAANQSATVDVVARATAQVFEGITEPQTGVLLGASVASTSTNIPGISVLPATDDPDPTNNSFSNAYIVRRPQADLGVSLTATPGAVTLGEAVTVRLTVTNGGPDTAQAVRLSGLGVLSLSHTIEGMTPSLGSCTTDAAGLVCSLGDLAANQSATVDVVARATAQVFAGITDPQTSVGLGASVASTSTNIPGISVLPATDDPDPNNNLFFTSYIVRRPPADLGVTLTATPGVVPLGDAVTVWVTVTNTGPDTARAVTLTGLGLLSLNHTIERVTPSVGSCAPDVASGLACDLGDLAASQSATVEVVARATAQMFEGITEPQTSVLLSARVASASDDPTPANDSVFTSYVVRRPQADLGVSLTATPGTVPLGDAVTLRLTVTNSGPDTARAVRLSGLGVLSLSHTIEGATSSLGSCATDAAGLVCALGDLVANQSATVDVVARATAQVFAGITDPQTSVLLGASVASTSTNIPGISVLPATDDPAPANNSALTSYIVRRPQADLGVSLTATPGTVRVGDAVTLRLTVTNAGPDTARAVTLSGLGALSSSHTIEGVTPAQGSCTPTPAAGVECALGDLAANQSATVDVVARPTAQVFAGLTDPQTSVLLGASVASTSDDPDPANNSVLTSYVVRGHADLAVWFSAPSGVIAVGDTVTFRWTVINSGPQTATGVVVSGLDALSMFDNVSLSATQGQCSLGVPANPAVQCSLGTLAPAAWATVTVTATLTARPFGPGTAGGVVLSMSSTATADTFDPQLSNNNTTTYVLVSWLYDVVVSNGRFTSLSGDTPLATAVVGDTLVYRFSVLNRGPRTPPGSFQMVLPGMLPIGLPPSCATQTTPGTATVTVRCPFAPLAAGASIDIAVRLQIGPGAVLWRQTSAVVVVPAGVDLFIEDPSRVADSYVSTSLTVFSDTPAGVGVTAPLMTAMGTPVPVSVTFSSVTRGGQTVADPVPTPLLPLSSGYRVASLVYDIYTSATYVAPVTVCIDGSFGATDFLLHYEGGTWVQLPNQQRLPTGGPPFTRVCATTTSLSPFVVGTQVSRFAFEGFFWPVRNPPVINRVKAGSAIPVRFSLGGDYGLNVLSPGFPQVARVSCGTGLPESEVVETDSAIRSGLVYNPFSKRYIYVWKTQQEMAGACWQLTLRFTDGTQASALFKMRK